MSCSTGVYVTGNGLTNSSNTRERNVCYVTVTFIFMLKTDNFLYFNGKVFTTS